MEIRHFPSIGADISLLGFGGMRLPILGNQTAKIDYPTAERMVETAIRGGVNYFDTAWPYHAGESETFMGAALSRYPRESFLLADKLPTWDIGSEADIHRIFKKQLQKCKVEYFDFYLVHCLDAALCETLYDVGIFDILRKKKEAGLIRRLGFSFHDNADLMEKLVSDFDWDFTQVQLNYMDWTDIDARRLYEIPTGRNIPVIVMEPVRGGTLAKLNDRAAGILKNAAPDVSVASWAIRFAASLPNVLTVLSGMSTPEQVEDNLKTLTDFRPLSDAERAVLAEAISAFRASGTVPCTGCRYCMDCPAGVDIPRVFAVYNQFCLDRDKMFYGVNYQSLRESQRANRCAACGQCVAACPQKIDIPGFMRKITKTEPV